MHVNTCYRGLADDHFNDRQCSHKQMSDSVTSMFPVIWLHEETKSNFKLFKINLFKL